MTDVIEPNLYLNSEAVNALNLPIEQRIEYVRSSRWIGYPKAIEIIGKLEDLLIYPKRHRMPCLLIVGDSNSGKTMIADRFTALNKAYESEDKQSIVVPVLSIQSPPVPNETRLYSNILEKLFAPYRTSDPTEKKQYQVIKLMKACNVKMLMIDEIHSLLAGNLEKQRTFLSVLRNLANELQIPIVGLGTKDALRAIKTDSQLDNRFKSVYLPRWEHNTDFRRLLASFEHMIPLSKPSNLKSPELSKKLLVMSEGLLGELSEVISEAAVLAIQIGKEKIDLDILASLDWQAPSIRRRENG
jgi:type II secretory pathway predicted ATPase ExeA